VRKVRVEIERIAWIEPKTLSRELNLDAPRQHEHEHSLSSFSFVAQPKDGHARLRSRLIRAVRAYRQSRQHADCTTWRSH
jgi:hypothetical protein